MTLRLAVLVLLCSPLLNGCDNATITAPVQNDNEITIKFPDDSYAGIFISQKITELSTDYIRDTAISSINTTFPPFNFITVQFGQGDQVLCAFNNTWLTQSGKSFYADNPPLHLDGTPNYCTIVQKGNRYDDTLIIPIGVINFLPKHLDTVAQSIGAIVSWEPSSYPDDYVQISVMDLTENSGRTVKKYQVQDDGSFTIKAEELAYFKGRMIDLELTRTAIITSLHGSRKYSYVVSSSYSKQLVLD